MSRDPGVRQSDTQRDRRRHSTAAPRHRRESRAAHSEVLVGVGGGCRGGFDSKSCSTLLTLQSLQPKPKIKAPPSILNLGETLHPTPATLNPHPGPQHVISSQDIVCTRPERFEIPYRKPATQESTHTLKPHTCLRQFCKLGLGFTKGCRVEGVVPFVIDDCSQITISIRIRL